MLDILREHQRIVDAQPPRVARFIASHSVPYGRVYRMWTTRGEMIAYVNRGEIADMPRAKNPYGIDIAVSRLCPPGLIGVPVVLD